MYDETDAVRGPGGFSETTWTLLDAAAREDGPARQAAVGELLARYWRPVYCRLRRDGFSNDQAKDLTQGFFCDIVLARDLFSRADRRRGRFRSLLCTALRHYVSNAMNRRGGVVSLELHGRLAIDMSDEVARAMPDEVVGPDHAYDYAWAAGVIDSVLAEVAAECQRDGLADHWRAFEAFLVQPALTGAHRPSQKALAEQLGCEDAKDVANYILTVRRKFRKALRRRVASQLTDGEDVDEEILSLLASLTRGGRSAVEGADDPEARPAAEAAPGDQT